MKAGFRERVKVVSAPHPSSSSSDRSKALHLLHFFFVRTLGIVNMRYLWFSQRSCDVVETSCARWVVPHFSSVAPGRLCFVTVIRNHAYSNILKILPRKKENFHI